MRVLMALAMAAMPFVAGCDKGEPVGDGKVATRTAGGSASVPSPVATDGRDVLTCDYPVSSGDSAAKLMARYGSDARRQEIGGAEGEVLDGIVLWPNDPARKLEVLFADAAMEHPVHVGTWESASRWRVAGLGIGDPLSEVVARNGEPVTFYGFEWDYGGYVTGFGGGELDRLAGGCTLGMRLDMADGAETPPEVLGDAEVRSDAPGLRGLHVKVDEISLGFPAPNEPAPK